MNGPCALVPLVVLLTILILDDLTSLSTSLSTSFSSLPQLFQDDVETTFRRTGWSNDSFISSKQRHKHRRDHGRELRWSHGSQYWFGARASPLHHPQHFGIAEDAQYPLEDEDNFVKSSITQP